MIKFLADESVDFRIVQSLRDNGYIIQTIVESNPAAIDVEVLKIANESKAILITEDKDFGELTIRLRRPNCGIILLRMSGMKINEKIEKVLKAFQDHIVELSDRFTVITYNKLRIREIKN
jgi:predicted nuclease of predicted toxin-antitoxin system